MKELVPNSVDAAVEKHVPIYEIYVIIAHGNDVLVVDEPDSMGWFVDESNLSGVTWSSSDTTVATIVFYNKRKIG